MAKDWADRLCEGLYGCFDEKKQAQAIREALGPLVEAAVAWDVAGPEECGRRLKDLEKATRDFCNRFMQEGE